MTTSDLVPGLVVGHLRLTRMLGSGSTGIVWVAEDEISKEPVVVKFFPRNNSVREEYYSYLVELLRSKLSRLSLPHVVTPLEVGEFKGFGYQVLPYLTNFKDLSGLMRETRLMDVRQAMLLVVGISQALTELHGAAIVHADLKPSNILVSKDYGLEVRLIDFGMVRKVEGRDLVELVSTWSYLHPSFKDQPSSREKTEIILSTPAASGIFIDIYALGVITLEMLTGRTRYDEPVTETSLAKLISEKNRSFISQPVGIRHGLSNLLLQMLSVNANRETITAQTIASLAQSLVEGTLTEGPGMSIAVADPEVARKDESVTVVRELKGIRATLEQQTVAMFARGEAVASLASREVDELILEQVRELFASARVRTQASWRLGIAMTIASFGIIVVMIAAAVGMSVATGSQWWVVIFGGAGVSTVIGTLIWRPYDRLFRATILAQEIELFHVRVMVGLRGSNRDQQLKIFDEAIEALRLIFREHSSGNEKLTEASSDKKRRRTERPA